MDAWILDESPGELPLRRDRHPRARPRRGAGPPGDLGPQPHGPLAHPRAAEADAARTSRDATSPAWSTRSARASRVEVGTEVVVNPAVAAARGGRPPRQSTRRSGVDSRSWASSGGAGTPTASSSRPGTSSPSRPDRSWEECAAFPLATLTAYRMLRRARLAAGETVLVVGIGGGVSMAALALARAMGAEVYVTSREQSKIDQAVALGAAGGLRLRRRLVAGQGRRRRRVGRPGHLGRVGPVAGPRRPARGLRRHVRARRSRSTCPSCSSSRSRSSARPWAPTRSSTTSSAWSSQGLPVAVDQVFDRADYPAALERLRSGDQLGKVVLRHPRLPSLTTRRRPWSAESRLGRWSIALVSHARSRGGGSPWRR